MIFRAPTGRTEGGESPGTRRKVRELLACRYLSFVAIVANGIPDNKRHS
jgi:hypothetical protein